MHCCHYDSIFDGEWGRITEFKSSSRALAKIVAKIEFDCHPPPQEPVLDIVKAFKMASSSNRALEISCGGECLK